MAKTVYKYLEDIKNAITDIDSFFTNRSYQYQEFVSDICLRSAIQWKIAIIGEALNQALKIEPSLAITNARKIVDTRNYLIHGYDSLRPDIIWAIVINHLPVLRKEVERILKEIEV